MEKCHFLWRKEVEFRWIWWLWTLLAWFEIRSTVQNQPKFWRRIDHILGWIFSKRKSNGGENWLKSELTDIYRYVGRHFDPCHRRFHARSRNFSTRESAIHVKSPLNWLVQRQKHRLIESSSSKSGSQSKREPLGTMVRKIYDDGFSIIALKSLKLPVARSEEKLNS